MNWTEPFLLERRKVRFDEMLEGWADEASEATLDGNPRRGWYLETWMSERARAWEQQSLQDFYQRPMNSERGVGKQ